MKSTYVKLAAMAILCGSSALAFAGSDPVNDPPNLKLGVQNSVLAEMELADNRGQLTRVRLTVDSSSLSETIKFGPKGALPVKVSARILESKNHGNIETVVDLAQIALGRIADGDDDSRIQLDFIQLKFEENNDPNLSYSEQKTLNLISASIHQLVNQGFIPGTLVPVKLSVLGTMDLGAGKTNGEGAETDFVMTLGGCGQAEVILPKATAVNQICGTYVDADSFGTGSSGVDSTQRAVVSTLVKVDNQPFSFKFSGIHTDYETAGSDFEVRAAIQFLLK